MIKENRKYSKGITIIALLLTIIILLILSTIIIYNIGNNNSSAPYNNMIADIVLLEDKILVYYNKYGEIPKRDSAYITSIEGLNYYEIDLSKLENISLNYGTKDNGDKDIYLVNDKLNVYYLLGVELDGQTYHINNYKASNIPSSDNPEVQEKTLLESCKDGEYVIGDYIEYYPDEASAYDPDKGNEVGTHTGYTDQRQIITQERTLEWRLLYYDNNNVYLVSHKPTNNTLFLKGPKGYNNGTNIINEACNTLYSKQGIATVRNITIEDINTHLGGNTYDPNNNFLYGREFTFTDYYHPESWDVPEWSGTIRNNDYTYSVESFIKDSIHKDIVIGASINSYWISSRTQLAYGSNARAFFGIRVHSTTEGTIGVQTLCSISNAANSPKSETSGGASLRPVVCINKNATLTDLSK